MPQITEPKWILVEDVESIHQEQLALHGGGDGLRDAGLLASAIARPQDMYAYESADLCALAAAYAFGITKNHPFVDGNKRAGFLTLYTFLKINGIELMASEADAAVIIIALAAGEIDEAALVAWVRDNT